MRELVGIEFFFGGILEHLRIEPVVRSRGDQQGDGIGLLHLDGRIGRVCGHGPTFVEHLDLPLVVAVEMRNRSLEGQQIPLRRDRAGAIFRIEVGNLGAHGERKRALLIGGEPHCDHIVRVGGKILAFVSDPILLVGNMNDGFVEVERTAEVLSGFVVKIESDLRKVGQPAIPINPFIVKCLVGDLNALGVRATKDGGADITIADGVGPLLPILVVGISSFIGFRALPVASVVRRGLILPDLVDPRRGPRECRQHENER